MSSKFFTWTKGDRRASDASRHNGSVMIPAELYINGTEYGKEIRRSSRTSRRQTPVGFDEAAPPARSHTTPPSESLVFHDAAVRSATNLMAVMTDMLRSPPMTAHLTSQQSAGLIPPNGRPRSHTAPTTPIAEAPAVEPVELPGSLALGHVPSSRRRFDDDKPKSPLARPWEGTQIGHSIQRPHSSPQESTHAFDGEPRHSTSNNSRHGLHHSCQQSPQSNICTPNVAYTNIARATSPFWGVEAPQGPHGGEAPSHVLHRPSLSVLQSAPSNGPFLQPQHPVLSRPKQLDNRQSSNTDVDLMLTIAELRASHDAHVQMLKQAHETELASQHTYTALLERRVTNTSMNIPQRKETLTIDTSHGPMKAGDLRTMESANTLQSFETNLENSKRSSHDSSNPSEVQYLKRKLSLARKAQLESTDIRRERDHYRDSAEQGDKRIWQLKDIVKKAKENEKSLRALVDNLEARLQDANNARVDAIAGFEDACEQIKQLQQQLAAQKQQTGQKEDDKVQHHDRPQPGRESLPSTLSTSTRLEMLEKDFNKQRQMLKEVKSERDRYNSLLHSELRRSTRTQAQKAHQATPEIQAEAFASVTETIAELKRKDSAQSNVSGQDQLATKLEKELEHSIREIIMYKLDIKGYKKDLKAAHARIESLTGVTGNDQAVEQRVDRDPNPNGLGISYSRESRTRTPSPSAVASATKMALIATSPPAIVDLSPRPRKTPPATSTHKKLPRPPNARTPSPNLVPGAMQQQQRQQQRPKTPDAAIQRRETLRSLSESIISSYAQRSTPDLVASEPLPSLLAAGSSAPAVSKASHGDHGGRQSLPDSVPDASARESGQMVAI